MTIYSGDVPNAASLNGTTTGVVLIGGRRWGVGSDSFGSGLGSTATQLSGFDTGTVSLTNGHRYEFRVSFRVVRSVAGDCELRIRKTNTSGTICGYDHRPYNASMGYTVVWGGRYVCTGDENATFIVTAHTTTSGTMNVTEDDQIDTYFEVYDLGLDSQLTFS